MCKKIIFSAQKLEDIYNLYFNHKKSLSEIENIYNISQSVLTRIFKENGWKARKRSDHFIKYSVNDYYFDCIDNPDKAYCLGLLYADGCNHYDSHTISIELQEEDRFVLQKMNDLVNNERPIFYYDSTDKKNRTKNTYKLIIRSVHMSERLNELGVVPRKSLILDFPNWITKELFPSFLRGYIDGDGWVQPYRIGFMSTDKFCYGVKNFLLNNYNIESHVMDMKRHYNDHTKTLYICNKKNIIPLVKMMFSGGSIYMPRKLEKYIINNHLSINDSLIA